MATPTLIIRHPRERLSKCSLEPLRGRPELCFLKASSTFRFDASGFLLLAIGHPVLSPEDALCHEGASALHERLLALGLAPESAQPLRRPLLLLDSTWRLLPQLMAAIQGQPIYRSLPTHARTAYPRVSKISSDPNSGLASVEALYLARRLLGDDDPSLLDAYHWRDAFLQGLARN